MHIKYCKAILGVHRKSTNFAVLFELGRNPLYHKIIKAMLNYWFRLGTLNPFLSYSTKRTRSQKVFSCTIIRHGLHLSTKFWVSYLISKVLTYQNKSTYSFKKEVIMYYKTVFYKRQTKNLFHLQKQLWKEHNHHIITIRGKI